MEGVEIHSLRENQPAVAGFEIEGPEAKEREWSLEAGNGS